MCFIRHKHSYAHMGKVWPLPWRLTGTQTQGRAVMMCERSSRGEQGCVLDHNGDSPGLVHSKSLKCVCKNKKYLFEVGIFMICRSSRINRKLELREGKLYNPSHRLLLLGRAGSRKVIVPSAFMCHPCETENTNIVSYLPQIRTVSYTQ